MIKERIEEICRETGIPEEKIQYNLEQWATPILKKGVIVKLGISYWRAKTAIQGVDLGIDFGDFSTYINLGTKLLLPKEVIGRIKSIESASRRNLKENSFDTVWGSFVPCTMFNDWKEKNEIIKNQFYSFREDISKNYEKYKDQVINEYKEFCRKIWIQKDFSCKYEDFEKSFINKVTSEILTKDSLYKTFKYVSVYYFIPTPYDVELNISNTKKEIIDSVVKEQEKSMNLQIKKEIESYKSEQIQDFIDSTIGQMKDIILSMIEDIRKGMVEEESFDVGAGKSQKKILEMIKKIRKINFIEDVEINNSIDRLQSILDKPKKSRDSNEIWKSMKNLEHCVRNQFFVVSNPEIMNLEI